MKIIRFATIMVVALGIGAASAQQTTYVNPPRNAPGQSLAPKLAQLKSHHAFGLTTTSAFSRNVGPGSTVAGDHKTFLGDANSGMPLVPGAPSATTVSGGGH